MGVFGWFCSKIYVLIFFVFNWLINWFVGWIFDVDWCWWQVISKVFLFPSKTFFFYTSSTYIQLQSSKNLRPHWANFHDWLLLTLKNWLLVLAIWMAFQKQIAQSNFLYPKLNATCCKSSYLGLPIWPAIVKSKTWK